MRKYSYSQKTRAIYITTKKAPKKIALKLGIGSYEIFGRLTRKNLLTVTRRLSLTTLQKSAWN